MCQLFRRIYLNKLHWNNNIYFHLWQFNEHIIPLTEIQNWLKIPVLCSCDLNIVFKLRNLILLQCYQPVFRLTEVKVTKCRSISLFFLENQLFLNNCISSIFYDTHLYFYVLNDTYEAVYCKTLNYFSSLTWSYKYEMVWRHTAFVYYAEIII